MGLLLDIGDLNGVEVYIFLELALPAPTIIIIEHFRGKKVIMFIHPLYSRIELDEPWHLKFDIFDLYLRFQEALLLPSISLAGFAKDFLEVWKNAL
jgi:hypothetical protein